MFGIFSLSALCFIMLCLLRESWKNNETLVKRNKGLQKCLDYSESLNDQLRHNADLADEAAKKYTAKAAELQSKVWGLQGRNDELHNVLLEMGELD